MGPPSTPIIEFDHMKDQIYMVHVYGLVNDLKSGHAATFNWQVDVNLETKEIEAALARIFTLGKWSGKEKLENIEFTNEK